MADLEARVAKVIWSKLYRFPIFIKGLNPKYQRSVCPLCRRQIVKWGDHNKTCSEIEPFVVAIIKAQQPENKEPADEAG